MGQPDGSVVGADEVLHDGADLALPGTAAEDTVVTDPGLQMMSPPGLGYVCTEILGSHGLAHSADVVAAPLDREKARSPDRPRVDPTTVMLESAGGQKEPLEHLIDGLEVELGR
jgi:hypothetical protein